MRLFDKKREKGQGDMLKSQDVIKIMLATADACLEDGKLERAFDTYRQIVQMCPDVTAQYNLGSLYARGLGTTQDFVEGAYWFHQASQSGDEQAGKLQAKCMLDYISQGLTDKSSREIYEEMNRFVTHVFPKENHQTVAGENLYEIGVHYLNKKDYVSAAKLLRAAAEFCDSGQAQNYLGVLYNAGLGVEKNDLVALYWLDRATDHHITAAKTDRDGMFNAYKNNFSPTEFWEQMQILARWCSVGTGDIPKDAEKAEYWRSQIVK